MKPEQTSSHKPPQPVYYEGRPVSPPLPGPPIGGSPLAILKMAWERATTEERVEFLKHLYRRGLTPAAYRSVTKH